MAQYYVLFTTITLYMQHIVTTGLLSQCYNEENSNTLTSFVKKINVCKTYFGDISKRLPLYEDAEYIGCFETLEERYSFYHIYSSEKLTLEDCISKCTKFKILYSGVRNGTECYCAPHNLHTKRVEEKKCSKECPTDFRFYCGGVKTMQMYKSRNTFGVGVYSFVNKTYLGCFQTHWAPFLTGNKTYLDKMDIESCIKICNKLNSYYAGLQKRYYCLCGNNTIKTNPTSDKHCFLRCTGNLTQHCGGFHHIQIYRTKIEEPARSPKSDRHTIYLGCFRMNRENTFMAIKYFTSMTIDWCLKMCKERGAKFCAIQGKQCFIAVAAPTKNKKTNMYCDNRCPGNPMQYCGSRPSDPGRYLQVYWIQTPNQFHSNKGRLSILKQMKRVFKHQYISIDICLRACNSRGFQYAGMENGNICACGQAFDNLIMSLDEDCDISCPANPDQMCGGIKNIQIHSANILPGRYSNYGFYLGCYSSSRSKINQNILLTSNLTLDMCVLHCWKGGFNYAAIEKGVRCTCGNYWYHPGWKKETHKCTIKCHDNDYCGGFGQMQLYHVDYILKKVFGRSSVSVPNDFTVL